MGTSCFRAYYASVRGQDSRRAKAQDLRVIGPLFYETCEDREPAHLPPRTLGRVDRPGEHAFILPHLEGIALRPIGLPCCESMTLLSSAIRSFAWARNLLSCVAYLAHTLLALRCFCADWSAFLKQYMGGYRHPKKLGKVRHQTRQSITRRRQPFQLASHPFT